MSLSFIFEKNLKAQIVSILVRGDSRTARQILEEIKKKSRAYKRATIYYALSDLLENKVIIKYGTDYEINPAWLSAFEKDSNKALKKLLEKNLLGVHVKDLKHICACGKSNAEGFCHLCHEVVCDHCGFFNVDHTNCEVTCMNCKCGYNEGVCSKCGKHACLRCGKKVWTHEHQFCKKKNNQMYIGILEVDHQCWFSNLSEKYPEDIMLNNFSDRKDHRTKTHSGVVKINIEDKNKAIGRIIKQDIIKEAKIIHSKDKTHFIRTRADINKSVDEFTRKNNSILLNPVIARDSKEQNLIISPSQRAMKSLSKGLQEFGGKVRVICIEEFDINKINKIQNKQIQEFIKKVPKKELLDNLQKVRFK